MNKMGDEGYRTFTIYQARIALYNMLDYAYQNDVILKNPCNKMVKSDVDLEKRTLTVNRSMECRHSVGELEKHKEIDKIADALKVIWGQP